MDFMEKTGQISFAKTAQPCSLQPLALLAKQTKSGCNFMTKLLIEKSISDRKIVSSFSHATWARDHNFIISFDSWKRGIQRIYKAPAPAQIRFKGLQIFLRTAWTEKKQAAAMRLYPEGEEAYCRMCNRCLIQDIRHLFFYCDIAQELYDMLYRFATESFSMEIPITVTNILFHTVKHKNAKITGTQDAFILAVKNTIVRFREESEVANLSSKYQ